MHVNALIFHIHRKRITFNKKAPNGTKIRYIAEIVAANRPCLCDQRYSPVGCALNTRKLQAVESILDDCWYEKTLRAQSLFDCRIRSIKLMMPDLLACYRIGHITIKIHVA